jgi:tetratricopeptide (TPR) repeat protein
MSDPSGVAALLEGLGLAEHIDTFVEEEITDIALLESMGPEMLASNLAELRIDAAGIERISAALFKQDHAPTPEAPGSAPKVPAPSPSPSVDVVPGDVTQEEIDAVDAEARWLLNPLSMLDLSDTKDQLLKMMAAGVDYQKRGQFANARATYTRAIAMEAPNQRMLAALYYNRSACQRELGQLGLSLRDAQKAAELDPTMVKAHWRVADVALILKDHEAANEAIVAGLAQSPRSQPLLMLKLQLKL